MILQSKIFYEARLNKNITRKVYGGNKIYKKGTLVCGFTEKTFKKLTKNNIEKYSDLSICEGHGVYEYFDLEKDIYFVKTSIKTTVKEKIVKLKN